MAIACGASSTTCATSTEPYSPASVVDMDVRAIEYEVKEREGKRKRLTSDVEETFDQRARRFEAQREARRASWTCPVLTSLLSCRFRALVNAGNEVRYSSCFGARTAIL